VVGCWISHSQIMTRVVILVSLNMMVVISRTLRLNQHQNLRDLRNFRRITQNRTLAINEPLKSRMSIWIMVIRSFIMNLEVVKRGIIIRNFISSLHSLIAFIIPCFTLTWLRNFFSCMVKVLIYLKVQYIICRPILRVGRIIFNLIRKLIFLKAPLLEGL